MCVPLCVFVCVYVKFVLCQFLSVLLVIFIVLSCKRVFHFKMCMFVSANLSLHWQFWWLSNRFFNLILLLLFSFFVLGYGFEWLSHVQDPQGSLKEWQKYCFFQYWMWIVWVFSLLVSDGLFLVSTPLCSSTSKSSLMCDSMPLPAQPMLLSYTASLRWARIT